MASTSLQSSTQGCGTRSSTFCNVLTCMASSSDSAAQAALAEADTGLMDLPLSSDTAAGMSYH